MYVNSNLAIVNYSSHDTAYQRNKAAGLPGWDDAEGLSEKISLLTRVFSHADIPKAGRVLDIGCGAGNIAFWLETKGYDVVGIDISRVAIGWVIEEAKLRKSKLSFAVFDAKKAGAMDYLIIISYRRPAFLTSSLAR